MIVQTSQMVTREKMTVNCLVLGLKGVMMALLLSRVMANMVNTLAGTSKSISVHSRRIYIGSFVYSFSNSFI